jgi:hypothetical protein
VTGPIAAAAVALLVSAGAAPAGPAGQWTRVTPVDAAPGDEVAAARAPGGTLHVLWTSRGPAGTDLVHAAIGADGAPAGSSVAVVTSWPELAPAPALVAEPGGGLRVLFSGLGPGVYREGDVYSAVSADGGASWSLAPGPVSAPSDVHRSDGIAAGVLADGSPVFAWAYDFALASHVGLDPARPNEGWQAVCCARHPGIGIDGATGEAVLAWFSTAASEYGVWTQTIAPAALPRKYVPGSGNAARTAAVAVRQRVAVAGRAGAPGAYVVYGAGYPVWTSLWLWEHRTGRAARLWSGPVELPAVAAGADGRLWAAWLSGSSVVAMRSNRAVTRWGAPVRVTPPPGAVRALAGNGALGPLDLLVTVSGGDAVAVWHRRVLPGLALSCRGGRPIVCTVRDAGDPVPGASVTLGGRTRTTGLRGRVEVVLPRGAYLVRAAKDGYSPARTRVRAG